jgi:hypothetical protein
MIIVKMVTCKRMWIDYLGKKFRGCDAARVFHDNVLKAYNVEMHEANHGRSRPRFSFQVVSYYGHNTAEGFDSFLRAAAWWPHGSYVVTILPPKAILSEEWESSLSPNEEGELSLNMVLNDREELFPNVSLNEEQLNSLKAARVYCRLSTPVRDDAFICSHTNLDIPRDYVNIFDRVRASIHIALNNIHVTVKRTMQLETTELSDAFSEEPSAAKRCRY